MLNSDIFNIRKLVYENVSVCTRLKVWSVPNEVLSLVACELLLNVDVLAFT